MIIIISLLNRILIKLEIFFHKIYQALKLIIVRSAYKHSKQVIACSGTKEEAWESVVSVKAESISLRILEFKAQDRFFSRIEFVFIHYFLVCAACLRIRIGTLRHGTEADVDAADIIALRINIDLIRLISILFLVGFSLYIPNLGHLDCDATVMHLS